MQTVSGSGTILFVLFEPVHKVARVKESSMTPLMAAALTVGSLVFCSPALAESFSGLPARVTPGQSITLVGSGLPPGDKVDTTLQPTNAEGSNSDAIAAAPALVANAEGRVEIGFLWPAGYFSACTAVFCPPHPNNPWLDGESVNVYVILEGFEGENEGLTRLTTSITLAKGAKHCGRTRIDRQPGAAKVRVVHGHLACTTARRLIDHAFPTIHHGTPVATNDLVGEVWRVGGWLCSGGLGQSEVFCYRGAEQIDGSGRSDDGWRF